jgi:hypothetical protein
MYSLLCVLIRIQAHDDNPLGSKHVAINTANKVTLTHGQPLTAEARVLSRASPRAICGGQSGTGTGFPLSISFHRCSSVWEKEKN